VDIAYRTSECVPRSSEVNLGYWNFLKIKYTLSVLSQHSSTMNYWWKRQLSDMEDNSGYID
jgi:hypothetical protein